ncbi:unnamed protein product [Cuscuta campestris]|uniref:Uncharacterized protein n=1 Tax=Cuscuta campestris TaxID=132261 RepID=A0A484M0C8_9ASTE|nr:unnamed protein product [Cuscuta campestris]
MSSRLQAKTCLNLRKTVVIRLLCSSPDPLLLIGSQNQCSGTKRTKLGQNYNSNSCRSQAGGWGIQVRHQDLDTGQACG